MNKLLFLICVLVSTNSFAQSAIERIKQIDYPIAKITNVTLDADLRGEGDFGSDKEFHISMNQHFFGFLSVHKYKKGRILETDLISLVDLDVLKFKMVELDEYHGFSIDAFIALPFNYFTGGDDVYYDGKIALRDELKSITQKVGKDSIKITINKRKELNGSQALEQMKKTIGFCNLDKKATSINFMRGYVQSRCTSFKALLVALNNAGISKDELREVIKKVSTKNVREDRLGHAISGIDWYIRNSNK